MFAPYVFSCLPILWFCVWCLKKAFPYGYGEHNVCSSITPAFNFPNMKGIPIKRNRKTIIFILTRGAWSILYMSLFPLFYLTTTLPSHPLYLSPFCNMRLMRFFVLYALTCFVWPSLAAVAHERTAHKLFTLAAVGCHVQYLLVGLFLFTLLFCWLALVWASCCSSRSTVFVLP